LDIFGFNYNTRTYTLGLNKATSLNGKFKGRISNFNSSRKFQYILYLDYVHNFARFI